MPPCPLLFLLLAPHPKPTAHYIMFSRVIKSNTFKVAYHHPLPSSALLPSRVQLPLAAIRIRFYSAPASTEPPVLLEIQGAKATLTLNRPRTGNSLDSDLQSLLTSHLKDLAANHEIRAVVLTGKGKFFCTGMNLGAQGEGMKGNSAEQFKRGSFSFPFCC